MKRVYAVGGFAALGIIGIAIAAFLLLRGSTDSTPHQRGIAIQEPVPTSQQAPASSGQGGAAEAAPLGEGGPQETTGIPIGFRSGGTVHNAEMLYGTSAVASYLWDFGDGETSDEANPTHVYKEPGTYTVTLTITRQDGRTYTEEIVVDTDEGIVEYRGAAGHP